MANNERLPLANVLITDDLDRRPHRPPAYELENRALTRLAEAMVDSPQTLLQKVVEAALDLCIADSAGVSIFDPCSATGTFRWHAVTGQLSAEVGRQIP